MNIEILCTGDEIVSGKTINTNHCYMSRLLQDYGFVVQWGTVVGDDHEILMRAFETAAKRADVVIVNGGLGPTVDDLSQQVAAQTMGVPLMLNQQWLSHIENWYASRGRVMPEINKKQAMLPQGAEVIDNPVGTACGFKVTINGKLFFFTPGIPHELKKMFAEKIIPQLQSLRGADQVFIIKRFHTFGVGESRADELLSGIEKIDPNSNVKLGFQSHFPELEIKLTIAGGKTENLQQKLLPFEDFVRKALGDSILCEDDDTMVNLIRQKLVDSNQQMGLLETHTGGKIAQQLIGDTVVDSILKKSMVVTHKRDVAQLVDGYDEFPWDPMEQNSMGKDGVVKWTDALRRQWRLPLLMVVLSEFDQDYTSSHGKMLNAMIVISSESQSQARSTRLYGSVNWDKTGVSYLALDCLRRFLFGMPTCPKIDFEQHD